MSADALPLPPAAALLGQPSQPGPAERVSARVLQLGYQHQLPGFWADDKFAQTNHYTGLIRLVIQHYLDQIGGAKFCALKRKRKTVKKSTSGVGQYSRDDEFEPLDDDHPLSQILKAPGGEAGVWSMGQECAFLTLQHWLTGDAPAWCPVNAAGLPVQFYSLTAATVHAQFAAGSAAYPNGSYRVTPYTGAGMFYAAGMLATTAVLPGEEVRFFRQYHPWARNMGMGVLQSGALEIDILEATSRSRWAYFDQALQLDSVIYIPGADEATLRRLEEETNNRHAGARNARKALFVGGAGAIDPTGKPVSVQQLGQGARELDFNSSFEQAAAFVSSFFRVPKVLLGLSESGSSYAADWAAQRRFYDLGMVPYARNLGVFLTQTLARPWGREDDEEYVIEVEIAPPQNVESEQQELQFALQQGVISVNEYRTAHNRKPVEGGDAPQPIFIQKLQAANQPQPDPAQQMGGPPGGDQMPPGAGGEPAPEGDENADPEEHTVQAALAMLGVPEEKEGGEQGGEQGDEPGEVEKAVPVSKPAGGAQQRREGEVWQSGTGWYTKKNGVVTRTHAPGQAGAAAPQQQQAGGSKPGPSGSGPKTAPGGGPRMAPGAKPAAGGYGDVSEPGAYGRLKQGVKDEFKRFGQEWKDAAEDSGIAGAYRSTKEEFQKFGAEIKEAWNVLRAGAAKLRGWFTSGKPAPAQAVEQAAATVPVTTPEHKAKLANVGQWAGKHADKHADRVAAHFGISREQAHRAIVQAMTQIAGRAGKVTIRDARSGKTATLTEQKAMSAYAASSGGALVPPAGSSCHTRKKKRKRALVAKILKGLE